VDALQELVEALLLGDQVGQDLSHPRILGGCRNGIGGAVSSPCSAMIDDW
jgi:hypothetical protein